MTFYLGIDLNLLNIVKLFLNHVWFNRFPKFYSMRLISNFIFQSSSDNLWPWYITLFKITRFLCQFYKLSSIPLGPDFSCSNTTKFCIFYLMTLDDFCFRYVAVDLINWLKFPWCNYYDPCLVEIHQRRWTIRSNINPFFTDNNSKQQWKYHSTLCLSC